MRRVTVNLAPADLRKAGPAYDLPIAVAVLLASGQIPEVPDSALFLGELSLDGGLRHTNAILPMVAVARDQGFKSVHVPIPDADEAALVEGIDILPSTGLVQLLEHLRGETMTQPHVRKGDLALVGGSANGARNPYSNGIDLEDIRGQEHAKRALEVAAAGAHNLLMSGPPGSGKTLLARSIPNILPRMTREEALDVTKIYSVSGLLPSSMPLIDARPFRAPHYTISNAGLVGGGWLPRPGEVSLSHRGVLFLDELPEFGPTVLELLRQPIEDEVVTISLAQGMEVTRKILNWRPRPGSNRRSLH